MRPKVIGTFVTLVLISGPALWAQATRTRVVVLGFDGADARITERLMREGRLPHLKRLAEQGTFRPLIPTNPPQTPVSWSSMATGWLPGRTGIFDFLKREPGTYRPAFALMEERGRPFLLGDKNPWFFGAVLGLLGWVFGWRLLYRLSNAARWISTLLIGTTLAGASGWAAYRYLPVRIPEAINHRRGTPFWRIADAAGLRVRVIRYPTTFPCRTPTPRHDALGSWCA